MESKVEPKRSPAFSSFTWIYIVGLVVSLGVFGIGLYLALHREGWALLAAGCVSLVAVLVTWPVATVLSEFRQMAVSREDDMATTLTDRLQEIGVMLNLI